MQGLLFVHTKAMKMNEEGLPGPCLPWSFRITPLFQRSLPTLGEVSRGALLGLLIRSSRLLWEVMCPVCSYCSVSTLAFLLVEMLLVLFMWGFFLPNMCFI